MNQTEVVIVGAGAIGLNTAYQLARRGRQVVVVDRDKLRVTESQVCTTETPFRSATSWAASGILPPANLAAATDPIERLRGLSHQLYPELIADLMAESGVDPQFERCGGWYLSDTPGETASLVGMISFWKDLNIECEEVERADFIVREPAMSSWVRSTPTARAWWVPDEYRICTPLYLQALIAACKKRGVTFLDQSQVTDLEEGEAAVRVSVAASGSVSDGQTRVSSHTSGRTSERPAEELLAEQVVICGGVWSGLISDRLKLAKSLVPVRGQILLLQTDEPILSSVVNFGHRYLVPRRDGAVLVGSCEEEVGFQHGTTPRSLEEFRQFATTVCPALATAREMAAWSGLRPLTYDGFPMCGKVPDSDRLFVAAGHFRSGVHLAPGTSVCLADVMCGKTPIIDLDAFGVGKQQHHAHIQVHN